MSINSIATTLPNTYGYQPFQKQGSDIQVKGQSLGKIQPSQQVNNADTNNSEVSKNTQKDLASSSMSNIKELSEQDLKLIEELKKADRMVKAHEMAHVAAGGNYIRSGASYQYKIGPDGGRYAVAGEVSIDVSAEPGDPGATIRKMQAVKRAALAPTNPSAQDRRVASKASQTQEQATTELALARISEKFQNAEMMEHVENTEEKNSYDKTYGASVYNTIISQDNNQDSKNDVNNLAFSITA